MKKLLMLGAIAATLALTGCNNFRLQTSIPTIELSTKNVELADTTTTVGQGQSVTTYSLNFTLEARTLPGSPGGTILAINLVGGNQLPAGIIAPESCPNDAKTLCGPYTLDYKLGFGTTPPNLGTIKIESYVVKGFTGNTTTVVLDTPTPVY